MYKNSFGRINQIHFASENEYYEFLGYLAKSDGSTSIVWEHNEEQGAWGSEGRIQIHINNFPFTETCKLTAGRGRSIINRVNCNEFVMNIVDDHNFIMGNDQNIDNIRNTVPTDYLLDFNRGLNL